MQPRHVIEIDKKVYKKTSIIIDQSSGYYTRFFKLNILPEMGYHHYTVNHDREFINPATNAHTNTIDRLWGNLKVQMSQKHGLTTEHKCEILGVYM